MTRAQAQVRQMRYKIWVCYEAKARGAFRIRLYTQHTQIDIAITNHKHKVDNMTSVNKPRASEQRERASTSAAREKNGGWV